MDYHFVQDFSLELIHMVEFLALKLSQSYENWEEIFIEYKHYGNSVIPGYHCWKYKGYLDKLNEDDDICTDIPFSDLYNKDPAKACTPLSKEEWTATVEQKKQEGTNPFWTIYELPW